MTKKHSPAPKIMIIRHAEKPPTTPPPNAVDIDGVVMKDSLIVRGWQRAGALAVLFAPSKGPLQDPRLATPQFIYASHTSAKEGNRPEETVTPLIDKLKLKPNFHFEKKDISDVKGVVASALSCKGIVLISWPHGMIPKLAGQIPLSSKNRRPIATKWPGNRFDIVWVFDLDVKSKTGGYIFSQVPQLLLAGDSSKVI